MPSPLLRLVTDSSSEHRPLPRLIIRCRIAALALSRDDGENSETKKLEKRTIIVGKGGRGLIRGSFIVTYLPLLPLRCHSRVRCCSQSSHTSFLPAVPPLWSDHLDAVMGGDDAETETPHTTQLIFD